MSRFMPPVVGYRKDGRPIYPIRGATEPPEQPPVPSQPPTRPTGPDKPDGVSDAEWAALGDPGKTAIVRERAARSAAEQALAAEKAKTPPKPPQRTPEPPKSGPDDVSDIVRRHIEEALTPFREAEAAREASQAAERIREAVQAAAKSRFHDAGDAVGQIDMSTLTDGHGRADDAKVKSALDDLLTRKPYLGKAVDTRRRGAPGSPVGATPTGSAQSLEDRVKEQLALMNRGR